MSKVYNERVRYALIASIVFGISLALILLIAAISIPQFYSSHWIDTDSSTGRELSYRVDIGAFQLCQFMETTVIDQSGQSYLVVGSQCSHIRDNCRLQTPYTIDGQSLIEGSFVPHWSCSKFNAFRSIFVIAIASTFIALITVSIYLYISTRLVAANRRKILFVMSTMMLSFSSLSLIISWALAASSIDDMQADRGPSFGLAVTGWVAEIVALTTLVFYHLHDPMREVENGIMTSRRIELSGKPEATSQIDQSTIDKCSGDIELQTFSSSSTIKPAVHITPDPSSLELELDQTDEYCDPACSEHEHRDV